MEKCFPVKFSDACQGLTLQASLFKDRSLRLDTRLLIVFNIKELGKIDIFLVGTKIGASFLKNTYTVCIKIEKGLLPLSVMVYEFLLNICTTLIIA